MEERIEMLERKITFLQASLTLANQKIEQLEKQTYNGRQLSLLPLSITGLHPLTPIEQKSDNELLMAVCIGCERFVPVIRIQRSLLEEYIRKKEEDVIVIDEYIQTNYIAEKKPCFRTNRWEWCLR